MCHSICCAYLLGEWFASLTLLSLILWIVWCVSCEHSSIVGCGNVDAREACQRAAAQLHRFINHPYYRTTSVPVGGGCYTCPIGCFSCVWTCADWVFIFKVIRYDAIRWEYSAAKRWGLRKWKIFAIVESHMLPLWFPISLVYLPSRFSSSACRLIYALLTGPFAVHLVRIFRLNWIISFLPIPYLTLCIRLWLCMSTYNCVWW